MSKVVKRIILAPKEVETTSIGQFFVKLGYSFAQVIDEKDKEFIVCILDNFLPELQNIPRLKTNIDCSKDYNQSYVDFSFLNNPQVGTLLERYFSDKNELDLIDRYSKKFKNVYSLKIHDYFNFGYFIDSVLIEAHKEKFNLDKIRQYLNVGLYYVFNLIENKGNLLPIDVSFSHDGSTFALQISATIPEFRIKSDFLTEIKNLEGLFTKSNFVDLTYVESRERLTLSCLWFKEEALSNFHSRFYTILAKRKHIARPSRAVFSDSHIEKIKYTPKKVAKVNSDEKREIARKISIYIIRTNAKVKTPRPLNDFVLENVKEYVARYPNKKESKFIDEAGLELVLEFIHNSKESINEVEEALRSVSKKETELEDLWKNSKKVSSPELNQDTNKSSFMENLKEELVKSYGNSPTREIDENELVKLIAAKTGASEEKIINILNDNQDNSAYSQFEEVLDSEVNEIGNDSIDELTNEDLHSSTQSQEINEINKKILVLTKEKRDLEIKLERLKDINSKIMKTVEKLKESYVKSLKQEKTVSQEQINPDLPPSPPPGYVSISQADLLKFRKEIEKKEAEATKERNLSKNKEKLLEKIKSDLEGVIELRDKKIAELEKRSGESKETLLIAKVNVLERENKDLQNKLDFVLKKSNPVNAATQAKDHEQSIKKEKEVELLRSQMQVAQTLIEKFKTEKSTVEAKLRSEKELTKKLREDLDKISKEEKGNQEVIESNVKDLSSKKEIELLKIQLIHEKKNTEEKLKNLNAELKKVEYKNKILIGQLDEMNRKKGPSTGSKSNDGLIKQIEAANAKAMDVTQDLTEKKKENLKLKQENNLLTAKIMELERKITNLEKKAS